MLLYCLQKAARRITADEDSRHRSRILEDEFYKRWLLPRIERFYLKMGWRFDNSFALQSITSAPEVQRRQDMTLDITTSESRRCCTLRDVKENRIKRALGRFRRKRNRDTLEAVVTKELQVGQPWSKRGGIAYSPEYILFEIVDKVAISHGKID